MIHTHVRNENKSTTTQSYLAQDVIPGAFSEQWHKINPFIPGGFPSAPFFQQGPLGIKLDTHRNTFVFPMTHTSYIKLLPIVSNDVFGSIVMKITGWSAQVLPQKSKELFVSNVLGEYVFTPSDTGYITSPSQYSDPHTDAKHANELRIFDLGGTPNDLTTDYIYSSSENASYIKLRGQGAEFIQIEMMYNPYEPEHLGSCCDLASGGCTTGVTAVNCTPMMAKIWNGDNQCPEDSRCLWTNCDAHPEDPVCDTGACCCGNLGECIDTTRGICYLLMNENPCWAFTPGLSCPSPTECPSGAEEFGSCCDTVNNTCWESFRSDCNAPFVFSTFKECTGDCSYKIVNTLGSDNPNANFTTGLTKHNKVKVFGTDVYPNVYSDIPDDLMKDIKAGSSFVMALPIIDIGEPPQGVFIWGNDPFGVNITARPEDLGVCSAIAAGRRHALVIEGTAGIPGSLKSWGFTGFDLQIVPTDPCTAIAAAGDTSIAIRDNPSNAFPNGGLIVWGEDVGTHTIPSTVVPSKGAVFTKVSHGQTHAAVIDSNGHLFLWGDNNSGQCDKPEDLGTVKQVSCGVNHTIALKSNKTVVAWGGNTCEQASVPSDLGKCISVTAGDHYSCAVKENGQLVCWSCSGIIGEGQNACYDAVADDNEGPCHTTTISNGFYLGRTEITQAQWQAKIGSNPSNNVGVDKPVEMVSWNSIQVFLQRTGLRLPTESEWEYAYRAGNTDPWYGTPSDIAWTSENSDGHTHDVGGKAPNALGLYDMAGNVWEWCKDFYGETYYTSASVTNPTGPTLGTHRILRGGSFDYNSNDARASMRGFELPGTTGPNVGFRAARTATASTQWLVVVQDQPTEEDVPNAAMRAAIIASSHSWHVRPVGTTIDLYYIPAGSFVQGASNNEFSCGHTCPDHFVLTPPECTSLCAENTQGTCCDENNNNCVEEDHVACAARRASQQPGEDWQFHPEQVYCFGPESQCHEVLGKCCSSIINHCENDIHDYECTENGMVFTPYSEDPTRCYECGFDPITFQCGPIIGKCCPSGDNPGNLCIDTNDCLCPPGYVFNAEESCHHPSPLVYQCEERLGACCNNSTNTCHNEADWQCAARGAAWSFTQGGSCVAGFCANREGSCCNKGLEECTDALTKAQCLALNTGGESGWVFSLDPCFSATECPAVPGKCCDSATGDCFETHNYACEALGGTWVFTEGETCYIPLGPFNDCSSPGNPCCCSSTIGPCAPPPPDGHCCQTVAPYGCRDYNSTPPMLNETDCVGKGDDWVWVTGAAECDVWQGQKTCNLYGCVTADIQACCNGHTVITGEGTTCKNMYRFDAPPNWVYSNCLTFCDMCEGGLCTQPLPCGNCTAPPTYWSCMQFVPVVDATYDFYADYTNPGQVGSTNPDSGSLPGAYGVNTTEDACTNPLTCPEYPQTSPGVPNIRWNRYSSGRLAGDVTGIQIERSHNVKKHEFDMFISCGCVDAEGRSSIDEGWDLNAKPWVCDARHQVRQFLFDPYPGQGAPVIPDPAWLLGNDRTGLIEPRDLIQGQADSYIQEAFNSAVVFGSGIRRLRDCDSKSFWANPANPNWKVLGCRNATCSPEDQDEYYDWDGLMPFGSDARVRGYLSIYGNYWQDLSEPGSYDPKYFSPAWNYKRKDTSSTGDCIVCKFGSAEWSDSLWRSSGTNPSTEGSPFLSVTASDRLCPTVSALVEDQLNEFTVFIQSFSS